MEAEKFGAKYQRSGFAGSRRKCFIRTIQAWADWEERQLRKQQLPMLDPAAARTILEKIQKREE